MARLRGAKVFPSIEQCGLTGRHDLHVPVCIQRRLARVALVLPLLYCLAVGVDQHVVMLARLHKVVMTLVTLPCAVFVFVSVLLDRPLFLAKRYPKKSTAM